MPNEQDDDDFELDSDDLAAVDTALTDAPDSVATEDDAAAASDDEGAPLTPPAAAPATDPATTAPASGSVPAPVASVPSAPPAGLQRPQTAADWSFRVDGTDVQVPGAYRDGDHIVIPADAWDRHIQRQYVANRETWRREREGYVRRIAEASTARTERERVTEQLTARMEEVLADPQSFQAFAEDFQRNRELLIAQAREDALREQLTEREQREQQEAHAHRLQTEIVPGMQNRLAQSLEQMLSTPTFAALAPTDADKIELLRELWYTEQAALWTEHAHDDPVRGIPAGYIELNGAALEQALQRRAEQVRRWTQRAGNASGAAERNAAAIAPGVPPPPKTAPPMVRNRKGEFVGKATPPTRSRDTDTLVRSQSAKRRAVREELRRTNWLDDDDE